MKKNYIKCQSGECLGYNPKLEDALETFEGKQCCKRCHNVLYTRDLRLTLWGINL